VKVAVVTGGSSGIGAALARRLAGRGMRCILIARGGDRLERLAADIGAEAEVCDVGDRHAVDELARRVGERYGAVHLLVNNAGIPGRRGFLELEPERIEEVVRVNYLGSVWCLRAFVPLLDAGAPATVVNVVSVAGTVSGGPSGPYSAAKHAQIAFSRSVGAELASRGIRILTVNPGLTHTEGFPQDRFLDHPVWHRAVITPDRVADAIVAALRSGRTEITVPGYYRIASIAQGLAPRAVVRLASKRLGGR
jgi:short-subunit dehydrogenase